MKKFVLLWSIALFTFSQAKMVDGIAMIVNGEAVTTAEIHKVQNKMHISRQKAVDILIQDRLQKSAMKDITIPQSDIDTQIQGIANQNGISVEEMEKVLKEQGTSWKKYKKSIGESIKKQKFYRKKVASNIAQPSEDVLKLFYASHKKEFILPTSISMIEYSSSSESTLKKFLETKKKKGVKSRSVKKSTKSINPELLKKILQAQDGSFTRVLNAGDKYISYKVISKNGKRVMSYEEAKNVVEGRWRQMQQKKALKDYFKKMRTNADIQVIR